MAQRSPFSEFIGGILMIIISAVCAVPLAWAQEVPTTRTPRVVVMPWVYESVSQNEDTAAIFQSETIRVLRTHDRGVVDVVAADALTRAARANPAYVEHTQASREWMSLGIKNYESLDVTEAISNLSRGLRGYRKYGHVFVDPAEVAELLMYLALASLESQSADVTVALRYLEQMSLIAPERQIREGVYPEQVVKFYRSAITAIEEQIDSNGIPNEALVRDAARTVDADYVVVFSLLGNADEQDVVMGVFDVANGRALDRVRVRAPDLRPSTLRDLANRLTSRFVTCVEQPAEPEVPVVPTSDGTGHWAVQLNFSYLSFLEFPGPPDLKAFGNVGGTVGVSYFLTQEFSIRGAIEVLSSLRDRNGAVTNRFQTLRGFAGAEVGSTFGKVRLSVGANFETVFLPDVKICVPTDYRARFGTCPEFVPADSFGLFAGLNLRPRVSLIANSSFDLFAGANASFYVIKGGVNFPVAGELGLQYRF